MNMRRSKARQGSAWDARGAALAQQAASAEAEAATWQLVVQLHGIQDERWPGGNGGPALKGCGGWKALRHRIADLLAADELLNWCAALHCAQQAVCGEQCVG